MGLEAICTRDSDSGGDRKLKKYKGSTVLLIAILITASSQPPCGTASFKDSLFYCIKMRFFSTICLVAAGLANAVRGDCKISDPLF
jgi:hypothetical protein